MGTLQLKFIYPQTNMSVNLIRNWKIIVWRGYIEHILLFSN
jgi:hypothetical protein